jgi:hypothetical protein
MKAAQTKNYVQVRLSGTKPDVYHILKNLMNAFGIENVLHELPTYNEDTGFWFLYCKIPDPSAVSVEGKD